MKHKTYKFSILTLALVIIIALSAFFTLNFLPAKASGTVTVSGTNVFTSSGDANVIANREGEGEDVKYYTMFSFADEEDTVSYRRNLAYNWVASESAGGEDGENEVKTPVNKMFKMEIGFASVSFEKFVITFESQQYNKTKDNKAINYVMFFPAGEGVVNVLVTDDKDAASDDVTDRTAIYTDRIVIEFTAKNAGSYDVQVGNEDGDFVQGTLENVGGNYARSSTSTSNPVYPLIFNACFFEEDGEREAARMVLYSLNGQEFEVASPNHNEADDYYYGGTVTDNTPPVLCLNEQFNYFTLGSEIDIDYTVIDVLRTSPSSTVYYYVLDYDNEITDPEDKELFSEVEDDILLESDIDKYLPSLSDLQGTEFAADHENLKVDMLAKVYIAIKDTASSNSEEDEIFLDWYVPDNYKIKYNGSDYLAVATDSLGVTYNYDGGESSWSDADDGILKQYQNKVDEAARNLSAGSSNYFYLPSAEMLFKDNATAYTDMKFSIYFYHNSQQQSRDLNSNNLSINVTQQGAYSFTIYATDAAGNSMYYYDNGELKEFETSQIWNMYADRDDEQLYYKLPWFTFNVSYTGASFDEEPGMQPAAYVGTSYSSASFDVNGITGSYDVNYRLFLFDRAGYFADEGKTFTYEEFIGVMDELFDNPDTRKYFTEILEVSESDAEYERFKDYNWRNNSTSFIPQDANGLYYIRAELTDTQYNSDPVTSSLAVVASIRPSAIRGESDWLQNNVASVILLSVAGLALIGIIVLLLIKPKDKGDIDVQFENEKKKEKKKK